ncbi:RbsD or FucU transport [Frondihabitans sp. PAMC 28766]|uniref:RbsD/FucU domain-containing protein n=1 Tax=Frondihabitans sp. PAMC 28766 TaxID=1795630 RepID=UPI00078DD62B|nr:RbsD/FucU domain-containing protein [Frondihabitans sp. PAMC 28766]AMM21594.1 RbsD or FucU transport [Frondihabitans sp. PAMC 28766]
MLRYDLLHPPLLSALGAAGHGSKILLADGNYPYLTVRNPRAELVHLNLRPGVLTVNEVLSTLLGAVNFESATLMGPGDGTVVEAHSDYRSLLGDDVPFDLVDRFAFYDVARSDDVGLIVATADQRLFANLLLTIGLR